jgi:glucokinase
MTSYFGGIDLGGSFIKAGLLTGEGAIVRKFIVPAEVDKGIPQLQENLKHVGRILIDISRADGIELSAIGVGSPGTIKYPEGIVTGATPNIPGWIGTNISEIFHGFPCPAVADNDANCMGWAEAVFGAGRGTSTGFYITIGTGIGGAVVIDGRLYRGTSFCAGEFGHMVLIYNGLECKTGRRGCLEHYVNAAGLIRSVSEHALEYPESRLREIEFDVVDIFKAFRAGDPAARAAVAENADMLGTAIGSVVNLLNPEIVVIGGGMSQGSDDYIALIRKSVVSFAFESTASNLRIEVAEFGNDAGWIGAACLNIK